MDGERRRAFDVRRHAGDDRLNTANAPIWPTNMVSDSHGTASNLWVSWTIPDREGWAREVGRLDLDRRPRTAFHGVNHGMATSIGKSTRRTTSTSAPGGARCCEVQRNGLDLDRPERMGQRSAVRPERRTVIAFTTGGVSVWNGSRVIDRTPPIYIRLLTVDARPPGSRLGRDIHRLRLEMERIEC